MYTRLTLNYDCLSKNVVEKNHKIKKTKIKNQINIKNRSVKPNGKKQISEDHVCLVQGNCKEIPIINYPFW